MRKEGMSKKKYICVTNTSGNVEIAEFWSKGTKEFTKGYTNREDIYAFNQQEAIDIYARLIISGASKRCSIYLVYLLWLL
jgi:hypothetical protein